MQTLATTRMSSKGQVVIPEDVRKRLHLEAGAQFVVVGEGDVVILKTIQRPTMADFDPLVRKARQQARASGMKRTDIAKAIARARGKKCDW
ncbi:MAG: AbrB/MazE/SpoVT family DNA-binding domain-containing protein [Verrucomicrobia bacterium]|nr:AbrB/MazE/SpoVT family DNA-binding domain-containing protein [Verrucomicrobiota bacterium]MDA1087669.1 AbrB/MazE/SpoVT family DNA-binding domain-containing protein [Verrucomicrobiota bacterium]